MGEGRRGMPSDFRQGRAQALRALLDHCARHSPFYEGQEWAARWRRGGGIVFRRDIAITTAATVRAQTTSFRSRHVPPEDGAQITDHTSGSTGEVLEFKITERHLRMNALEDLRLKQGWPFGGHERILQLRAPEQGKPLGRFDRQRLPNGVEMWTLYSLQAQSSLLALRASRATWLSGYASQIHEALALARAARIELPLRVISTFGETVSPAFCEFARTAGYQTVDSYGSTETSLMAMECPLCGDYHVADRHLLFEAVRDDGSPAAPGEIGRVVVTPLYNRAMPLLRYAVGDDVELSRDNTCPRSRFAIRRVAGREKDMFKLPDGGRVTPMLPPSAIFELGLRKFKLIQTTLRDIELRYVPGNADLILSRETAQRLVDDYVARGFTVTPVRLSDIPRDPGGKYRMHESLVP
jgi:phenylacetate-CoA ligase